MIPKRAQYGKGRRRYPIKTTDQLRFLLENYLANADHDNHAGMIVEKPLYWGTSGPDLIPTIVAEAERYRNVPKGPGAKWKREIAEHLVFAPPERVHLTASERGRIFEELTKRIAPDSIAVGYWHVAVDQEDAHARDDLHIVVSNFTRKAIPLLRVSDLRSVGGGDYVMILRQAGNESIAAINAARLKKHTPAVPTVSEVRARKRKEQGSTTLSERIFKIVGPENAADRDSIVAELRGKAWKVRPTDRNVSVTPPEKTKPYRWAWSTLLEHLRTLREAWISKARECDRDGPQPRDREIE